MLSSTMTRAVWHRGCTRCSCVWAWPTPPPQLQSALRADNHRSTARAAQPTGGVECFSRPTQRSTLSLARRQRLQRGCAVGAARETRRGTGSRPGEASAHRRVGRTAAANHSGAGGDFAHQAVVQQAASLTIRDRTKPPQLPPPLALPQQPLVPPRAPAATAAAGPPPTASAVPRRAPARASAREAGASGSSSTGAAPGASVHP